MTAGATDRNPTEMKRKTTLGKRLAACALTLLLAACAHTGDWASQHNPLNGKVWDVAGRRFVDPAVVLEQAASARLVLLGEIHDNREHHRIQARILDDMLRRGRRPALVMEQYDTDQQDKIGTVLHENETEGKMRELSQLMRTSWDWPMYEPIARQAVQQGLPLAAANLSRDMTRLVSRNGFSALGADAENRLALESVWTPERQKHLIHEVYAGHCGKIPEHVIGAIAKAQRARDAVMADTLLGFRENGAVAIVGRGHARKDMGVPLYLAARAPDTSVLALGLVETDTPTDPDVYAYGPLGAQYDYLWFTPRTRRKVEPCDTIPTKPGTSS